MLWFCLYWSVVALALLAMRRTPRPLTKTDRLDWEEQQR